MPCIDLKSGDVQFRLSPPALNIPWSERLRWCSPSGQDATGNGSHS